MKRVRETLTKLEGVKNVDIDFAKKTATITFQGELAKAALDKTFEGSRYGVSAFEEHKASQKL
ncbi:MAG: heavy-metal-associated domain-containing protein [Planctomycetes bacterium]|nr:heavy-metal-associated domain-containing protein [Planctomycetota bacterium]